MKNRDQIWLEAVETIVEHEYEHDGHVEKIAKMLIDNPWLPSHVGPLTHEQGRRDETAATLLMVAAWIDAAADVELLAPLSNASRVDSLGDSAMIYALLCPDKNKRARLVQALIPHSDLGLQSAYRNNRNPAMFGIYKSDDDSTEMLLGAMTLGEAKLRCSEGENILHKIVKQKSARLLGIIIEKQWAAQLLDVKNHSEMSPRVMIAYMREHNYEASSEFLAKFEKWEIEASLGAGGERLSAPARRL